MGCSKGTIYVFDPKMMHHGRIEKYSRSSPPCDKRRRIEIVKWFEPFSEKENVNKFLVVYDDGTIYVYYTHKATKTPPPKEDVTLKFDSNGTPMEVSRDKVISTMQSLVEKYDFNQHYPTATPVVPSTELKLID